MINLKLHVRILPLIGLFLWCFPLHAQHHTFDHTYEETALYDIYYLGIPLGRVTLALALTRQNFTYDFTMNTTGVAKLVNTQTRKARVEGTMRGWRVPDRYAMDVTYPNKSKSVVMYYNEGNIADIHYAPEHDSDVPQQQWADARDPLTVFMEIVNYFSQPQHTGTYDAKLYDGKRLNHLYAKTAPATTKCATPCTRITLRRKALAGYSAKKMQRFAEGESPVFMTIYPDRSRLPHGLEVDSRFGKVAVVRVKK